MGRGRTRRSTRGSRKGFANLSLSTKQDPLRTTHQQCKPCRSYPTFRAVAFGIASCLYEGWTVLSYVSHASGHQSTTKIAATDSKDLASGAQALMTMICLDKPESSRSNSTLIGSDNSMLPSRVLSCFHYRRRLDTYDNIDSPFCRAKDPRFKPAC